MVVLKIITLISINCPAFGASSHLKNSNITIGSTFAQQNVENESNEFSRLLKSYEQANNSAGAFSEKLSNNLKADLNHEKKVNNPRFCQESKLSRSNDTKNDSTISTNENVTVTTIFQINATTINESIMSANTNDQQLKNEDIFTTLSSEDEIEYEYRTQQTDNVTIGLVVAISIVVFLIIVVNCFTFRIYLKEHKDDQSFQNDITDSPSNRTVYRRRGGSSPYFLYKFDDDSI
ncbi:hypothetical protein ACH3XW_3670 [Acanthocheilonema viteae]